jgi:uncharacterized protein YdcH (DUF465 family)
MTDAQLPLDDVKSVLLQTDDSFRQLVWEHHELDEHIRRLSSIAHLSNQEQLEETALKKRKLALKDRIEAIVRGHHPPSPMVS